jgi:hypothetical protein
MEIRLTDAEIARLIGEPKILPRDYHQQIQIKPKHGHKERELDIKGDAGSEFRLILRQSEINPLDFSIILAYRPPKSNVLFRLRRYNGKSHEHTNCQESQSFYDFHIHWATERYQGTGVREDTYAEATDRFADFNGAVRCMLGDCAFVIPRDLQSQLFEEDI